MAVTTGNSPIIMTAAGDNIGHRIKLNGFRVVGGSAAGDVIIRDRSGGKELWRVALLAAEDESESLFAFGKMGWVDDVYVDTLPAGARAYIYYE